MFSKWNIEGLQQGESVLSVVRIHKVRILNEDVGITHRLVLTDHRVMTISSPKVASVFGLGRFVRSKVLTSMPLTEVESASFEKTFRMEPGGTADYYSTLHIQTTAGNTTTYSASGSRRLRRFRDALQDRVD